MTYGTIKTWERVGNEIENAEADFVLLAQNGNMKFHCIHLQTTMDLMSSISTRAVKNEMAINSNKITLPVDLFVYQFLDNHTKSHHTGRSWRYHSRSCPRGSGWCAILRCPQMQRGEELAEAPQCGSASSVVSATTVPTFQQRLRSQFVMLSVSLFINKVTLRVSLQIYHMH